MSSTDARCLSPEAQEALRFRVSEAVRQGMKPALAARTFGVSRSSVWNWRRRVERGNIRSLKSKPRGRPRRRRLLGHQAATAVRSIRDRCPDPLKRPFALWTREAVQQLLADRFGLKVSVWTVGRYLAKWGLTPQKPLRRAYQRDPLAVQRWLDPQYPTLVKQAKAPKGQILWGDPRGLRSDHQAGTRYGRRGKTPVLSATARTETPTSSSTRTSRATPSADSAPRARPR